MRVAACTRLFLKSQHGIYIDRRSVYPRRQRLSGNRRNRAAVTAPVALRAAGVRFAGQGLAVRIKLRCAMIRNGVPLPSIWIRADRTVIDGYHRIEAHRLAGLNEIEVEIGSP
jgi:hypothetical protein